MIPVTIKSLGNIFFLINAVCISMGVSFSEVSAGHCDECDSSKKMQTECNKTHFSVWHYGNGCNQSCRVEQRMDVGPETASTIMMRHSQVQAQWEMPTRVF